MLRSELDVRPELDNAARRDPEERIRRARVARHVREELLPPLRHVAFVREDERLAAEEVTGLFEVEVEPALATQLEEVHHIGHLHEAVRRDDLVDVEPEVVELLDAVALDDL